MAKRILAAAVMALCGCATIIHGGGSQDIGFASSPSGAQVTVDGNAAGKTPMIASLKRGDNHVVRIELAGYQPYEATLTRSVSGWVWGNILFGGLIGLAVDALSGGLYTLSPEQVQGTLTPNAPRAAVADGVYVAVVLVADPSWKRIGQLERTP